MIICHYTPKESDWKLFNVKIVSWQEEYMKKLNEGYIDILKRNENASANFWTLFKKINKDSKKTGVVIENSKSKLFDNLLELLYSKVITFTDLNEFSEELQNDLKSRFYKKL